MLRPSALALILERFRQADSSETRRHTDMRFAPAKRISACADDAREAGCIKA